MTWPLAFSRAFGSSLVFPVSFHWLPVIFCFALIGCWSYSRYGVRSLIEVRIERFETIAESYWNLKTMFTRSWPLLRGRVFPYRLVISCPVSHLRLRCRLIIRLRPEISRKLQNVSNSFFCWYFQFKVGKYWVTIVFLHFGNFVFHQGFLVLTKSSFVLVEEVVYWFHL